MEGGILIFEAKRSIRKTLTLWSHDLLDWNLIRLAQKLSNLIEEEKEVQQVDTKSLTAVFSLKEGFTITSFASLKRKNPINMK